MSFKIGLSYRDLFKSFCYGMCSVATVAEYNKKKQWLDEIADLFPDIDISVFHCSSSSKYRPLAIICNDILQLAMTLND